jgi:hypothetical protein
MTEIMLRSADDVVSFAIRRHEQIKEVLARMLPNADEERREALSELRELLSGAEAASRPRRR